MLHGEEPNRRSTLSFEIPANKKLTYRLSRLGYHRVVSLKGGMFYGLGLNCMPLLAALLQSKLIEFIQQALATIIFYQFFPCRTS